MNIINFEQHDCKKVRAYLDSYLNDELLVETTHEVLRHLEHCPACHEAMENRRRVKALLKAAVSKETAPADLQEKIRKRIRKDAAPRWSSWTLVAAAAAVLIAVGILGLQAWKRTAATHTPAVAEAAGAQILEVGLKDHVHCALDAGFANREFTEAEMRERLGPQFFGLVAMVKDRLPGNYRVTVGHRCHAFGREYVHLVLKSPQTVLSLVVTKKNGESFTQNHVAAIAEAAGVPIFGARMNNLEVAGFETSDYLAFVVSDLGREENLQIALALAPPVEAFLGKLAA
jgi:mycothiol system anti-sigma-R factor